MPNSLEQLHNVRNVFDQLSNVKAIYRYLVEKITKLPFEQQAKWFSELKDQNLQWNSVYRSVYNSTIETKLRSFQIKLNLRAICNECSATWVLYIGYKQMQFL